MRKRKGPDTFCPRIHTVTGKPCNKLVKLGDSYCERCITYFCNEIGEDFDEAYSKVYGIKKLKDTDNMDVEDRNGDLS